MAVKAKINPRVLVWAREESGFPLDKAAEKMKIKVEKLEEWESGSEQPSIPQLRKISEVYKRPLAVFYLSEVPKKFRVMHDFRRLDGEVASYKSPQLLIELRSAAQRRDLTLELYAELGEKVTDFDLSASLKDNPDAVATKIREFLNISMPAQFSWRENRVAFNNWRTSIEAKNILVFQVTTLPTAEMRGFSIAEKQIPVIGINRKDAYSARTFSLLHEFVHLMLNKSSICDMDDFDDRSSDDQKIEVFCNLVAGSALVPSESLLAEELVKHKPARASDWSDETIESLAKRYAVSREVILRRLLICGKTTEAFYQQKRKMYQAQYKRSLEVVKEEGEEPSSFKRNMAVEALSVFGRHFTETVLNSYYLKRITLNDVSAYLGVGLKHIPRIEQRMGAISGF